MWKTPLRSPATTDTAHSTASPLQNQQPLPEEPITMPALLEQNPEYCRLYEKTLKSQRKVYASIVHEEQKQNLSLIKETISTKLELKSRQDSFEKKFGRATSEGVRRKPNRHLALLLGNTQQQENSFRLSNFLMDHRNAVELSERARLTEYHLRDQEKAKSKIDYLNRVEVSDMHRRTLPLAKDRSQRLFSAHNQLNYHLLRKTTHIRQDKPISQAISNARKNPTYLRMRNFAQIQYILNEDNLNLMSTRHMQQSDTQRIVYNVMRRLFLGLAFWSDTLRIYYDYVRERDFGRVVGLVLPADRHDITAQYVQGLIGKIIKYKKNKVIHFEDFREVLDTLKEQKGYDLIQQLCESSSQTPQVSAAVDSPHHSPADQEERETTHKYIFYSLNHMTSQTPAKYRPLLSSPIDLFIADNHAPICKLICAYKLQIMIKKLYSLNSGKIISKQYLPLHSLVEIMKAIKMVPRVVTLNKFVHTCYWYQVRREGYSWQEFLNVQVALGLGLDCTLAGLEGYLGSFDVGLVMGM